MHTLTSMELWGMVGLAFLSAGASYLTGLWRAEVKLRQAFALRKEIRALPGWQPVVMELHVSGYNYWEIAGKLNLDGKFVLRELTHAYSTLRMREPARKEYPRRLRIKSRMMHELAKVIA